MINSKTSHLLIRHQEIALKGKNRPDFEKRLRKNIGRTLERYPELSSALHVASGRFVVALQSTGERIGSMIENLALTSGVSAVAPCCVTEPQLESIERSALEWAKLHLKMTPEASTFAVRTRRVDKRFPLQGTEVDARIGAQIREHHPQMQVHIKEPHLRLNIEIRHKHALIYSWEKEGVCGLPMNAAERVVCLLSGGIDSPVAAYEVMRRGCSPIFLHFHSKPFTSEASISKVRRLASALRRLSPFPAELWLVPLLDIQKAVRDSCNSRYRTIHYRRFMMAIAQELAHRRGAKALVTGEALGQVASQTLANMQAIEDAITLPVLRPLVTSDKSQIIDKAKKLGTYEISIEPHDDSCILFAPSKPSTQARLSSLREEEGFLPRYEMIFAALDQAEKLII